MRRWSVRILVAVIVLLLLLAAVVQVVLWTDWPRRMVVAQLQRELGLRVQVESLSVGWLGSSSLHNASFTLPLAQEAMLTAPQVRVRHAWVPWLIVGGALDLQAIHLVDPVLIVRQDAGGRWNAQDLAELLARAGGSQKAQASGAAPASALPRVSVDNGTVQIIDRSNRQATIQPVALDGRPESLLLWKYDLRVPSQLELQGELAPGGRWKHQVVVDAQHVGPWVSDWIEHWPDNAAVQARWAGQLDPAGGIIGRLDVEQSRFGDYSASGGLAVQGQPSDLRVRPDHFVVESSANAGAEALLPRIRTIGGSAALAGSTIRTEGLRLAVADGIVDLDGQWNFFNNTASLAAEWKNVALPNGVVHGGTLQGSIAQPWPGQLQLDLQVQAHGSTSIGGGTFAGDVRLSGVGDADWDALDLQLTAPTLAWESQRSIAFHDVKASISKRGSKLAMEDLRATTQGQITGSAAVDLASGDWKLWLDAGGWALPTTAADASLNFTVNAWGNREKVRLEQLSVGSGDIDAVASGWYVYALPKPLKVDVYLTHLPDVAAGTLGSSTGAATTMPVAAADAAAATDDETHPLVRGKLRGEAHLNGTVKPLQLDFSGTLFGKKLFVRQRPIGDVALVLNGQVDRDQAQFESDELTLLGGRWRLRGYYPFGSPRPTRITVEVQDLPLAEVSDLMENTDFAGTLDGRWLFDVPSWSWPAIGIDGSFEAENVRAPHFAADRIEASVALENGVIRVDPIAMQSGADGSAQGSLSFDVRDFTDLKLAFSADRWPVEPDRTSLSAAISGTADLDVNLGQRTIFGPLDLSADVRRDTGSAATTATTESGLPLGEAHVRVQFTGRTLDVQSLDADALGGRFRASATIDRDNLLQTIAQAEWKDVSAERIVELFPRARGLAGTFAGAAKLAPARDPRALEPLHLSMAIEASNASLRGAQLGNAEISAYLNTDRFVLDSATVLFADGTLDLWARASRHADDPLFAQVIVNYDRLDLNQLVHMGAPAADAFPGRLTGQATLVGSPRRLDNVFGDGSVQISDAEIGSSDIIEPLYIAMNLGKNFDQPTGSGSASLHLERSTLDISQLRYFNRGAEVRANATIREVWKLPDSPIEGFVVGSARPLKDIKLPWLADVDQIFAVLQTNVTTVRIDGTVRNPRPELVPFSEIGDAMRRFLFGDVKQNTPGK